MEAFKIIEEIAEMTPDNAQAQTRDEAIKNMGQWGKKLVMAALPTSLMMLAFQKKAQASGSPPSATAIGAVLNFALKLERLESTFYKLALAATDGSAATVSQSGSVPSVYQASPGLIPSSDRAVFRQISKHEDAHVNLLITAIQALGNGVTVDAAPDFDFTTSNSLAHTGNFQPFKDYSVFLQFAQAFEDTGVRAYKGQAGNLQYADQLTVALQIHSVEARHAAEVRKIRGQKSWITQSNGNDNINAAFNPVYAGENLNSQAGVSVFAGVSADAVTESFDEPLDMAAVGAIANLVIIHP